MSRYAVNLEALLAFTDRLATFNANAESIGAEVDRQVSHLHAEWLGAGANSHADYHARWTELFLQMRETLAELRHAAITAHDNYTGAAATNVAMWP